MLFLQNWTRYQKPIWKYPKLHCTMESKELKKSQYLEFWSRKFPSPFFGTSSSKATDHDMLITLWFRVVVSPFRILRKDWRFRKQNAEFYSIWIGINMNILYWSIRGTMHFWWWINEMNALLNHFDLSFPYKLWNK